MQSMNAMTLPRLSPEQLLEQFGPLRGMPASLRAQLLATAKQVNYAGGQVIFRQGDRDLYAFFLLQGAVQLLAADHPVQEVRSGTETANRPLAQLQPRRFTARAKSPVSLLRLDRLTLERVLSQTASACVDRDLQVCELREDEASDWMSRLLKSELFAHLPAANIQRIFAQAEIMDVTAGQIVVSQGALGDYYYIVRDGRCEVTRRTASGGVPLRLAELDPGATFGEEALIANARRNASVVMLTDGELMRLSREDFVELIRKPLLRAVTLAEARSLVAAGAQWLDVRYADEHARNALGGERNIPLNVLRVQLSRLDPAGRYVVICDNGARSAVGTFLLVGRGYDAVYLDGGLAGAGLLPAAGGSGDSATPGNVVSFPPPTPAASPVSADPDPEHPALLGPAVTIIDPVEAEVVASTLRAELAKANVQLELAMRLQAEAEATRRNVESQAEERVQAERERVEAEAARAAKILAETRRLREELESARRAAEQSAERQRQEEEARLQQLKADTERRLQEERQKLEQAYGWKEAELLDLLKKKEEAERNLLSEKQRLASEAQEAKQRLSKVRQAARELEVIRQQAAQEAEQRVRDQQEIETRLREEITLRVAEERRALESEFVKNAEALAAAERERQSAEVARAAATEEAERIIAEYKAAHERLHAEVQEQLRAERARLEAEAAQIQATLAEAHRAKAEAEAAKAAAEEQVACLRILESEVAVEETALKSQLQAGIASYRAEAERADLEIQSATQAEARAEADSRANSESIVRQINEEQVLLTTLQGDLESWLKEQETIDNSEGRLLARANQQAQMDRIRARANEVRRAVKEHDQQLLDELADRSIRLDDW
jgi:CRP-like cAMP-binding protein